MQVLRGLIKYLKESPKYLEVNNYMGETVGEYFERQHHEDEISSVLDREHSRISEEIETTGSVSLDDILAYARLPQRYDNTESLRELEITVADIRTFLSVVNEHNIRPEPRIVVVNESRKTLFGNVRQVEHFKEVEGVWPISLGKKDGSGGYGEPVYVATTGVTPNGRVIDTQLLFNVTGIQRNYVTESIVGHLVGAGLEWPKDK